MKRYIKTAAEAAEERNNRDNETRAAIDVMRDNEQYQDDPEVGIFWYDPKNNELFGVTKALVSDVGWYHSNQWNSDVRTDKRLHKNIWQKGYFKGKDKRFFGDHTLVPRGRVFEFKGEGLKVFVGDWIDEYPQAKELIIDEFNLPNNVEFVKDIHWCTGHGWSDEF